eukprot:5377250-Amphidinium_carterae.1
MELILLSTRTKKPSVNIEWCACRCEGQNCDRCALNWYPEGGRDSRKDGTPSSTGTAAVLGA